MRLLWAMFGLVATLALSPVFAAEPIKDQKLTPPANTPPAAQDQQGGNLGLGDDTTRKVLRRKTKDNSKKPVDSKP